MGWLRKSPSDYKLGYYEVKSFNNGNGFYVCCGKRIVRSYEYEDKQYSRLRAEELCEMLNEE